MDGDLKMKLKIISVLKFNLKLRWSGKNFWNVFGTGKSRKMLLVEGEDLYGEVSGIFMRLLTAFIV